jgi:predicted O-methyltransferase YrrM
LFGNEVVGLLLRLQFKIILLHEFFPEQLDQFTSAHTKQPNSVLQELERETYAKIYMPQMVSGHVQGRFLSMISKLV